ncbi:hypothetical protein CEP54_007266 [Fusarium duplospermum]|uniref:Uncharacterized protein n=1 Tax=Fusarium duplospermum TaxID=1325734 RepID=A0A428Q2D2_9HYPO|nr:hypothetical protein CEP54_007266 [Fusarium duplospermum]
MDSLTKITLLRKRGPPKLQIVVDFLTIIGLFALVGVMVWVIKATPEISRDIPYVTTGVTVAATLFTSVVKGRVQHGLMRGLEAELRSISSSPEPGEPSPPTPWWKFKKRQPSTQELLDRKWRGILAIDDVMEKVLYNKRFFLMYLGCALLTAAIVAVFTPNPGTKLITYHPLVPGPLYSYDFNSETKSCAGQGEEDRVQGTYRWELQNGSSFFSRFQEDCPSNRILSHVYNINFESPDKYAYVDAGVAVDRMAMGASANLFRGSAFQKLTDKHGRFLKSTTQCVPVMTSNPVTCKKGGGKLERGSGERTLVFTLDDGQEVGSSPRQVEFSARNLSKSSVMVNYLYSDDRNYTVGPGIISFSAYNDPDGVTTFAKDLARTINDPDKYAGTRGSETYVVTCKINPLDSFEYRLVTLSLQTTEERNSAEEADNAEENNSTRLAYSRRLSGGEPCHPATKSVSNLHFVAATTSQYRMVMENYGLTGYFTTVHSIAGEDRKPPYAFNNSRNGLEDALGVIAALGVSNMDLGDAVVADARDGKAEAVIEIKQLGGNRLLHISLIPPLFSIVTLLVFFVGSFRRKHRPGGGVVDGESPGLYAAESIRELIKLGKPVAERIDLGEQHPLIE